MVDSGRSGRHHSGAFGYLLVLIIASVLLTIDVIPNYLDDRDSLDPSVNDLKNSFDWDARRNTTMSGYPDGERDMGAVALDMLDVGPRARAMHGYDAQWLHDEGFEVRDQRPAPVPLSGTASDILGIPGGQLEQNSDLYLDYWIRARYGEENATIISPDDPGLTPGQRPFVHPSLTLNLTGPIHPLGGVPTPVDVDGDGIDDVTVEVCLDVELDGAELMDDVLDGLTGRQGDNATRADPGPSVSILYPLLDGQPVIRDLVVTGVATGTVTSVQVSLLSSDGHEVPQGTGSRGEATLVTGPLGMVTQWSYPLAIGALDNGRYRISVRASDGDTWSPASTRDVILLNPNYGSMLTLKVELPHGSDAALDLDVIYPIPTRPGQCIVVGMSLPPVDGPTGCSIALDPNIVKLESHILDWSGLGTLLTGGVVFQPLEGPFNISWEVGADADRLGLRMGLLDVTTAPDVAETMLDVLISRLGGDAASRGELVLEMDAHLTLDGELEKEFTSLSWSCSDVTDVSLSLTDIGRNGTLLMNCGIRSLPDSLTMDMENVSTPDAGLDPCLPYQSLVRIDSSARGSFGPMNLSLQFTGLSGGSNITRMSVEVVPASMEIEVPMSFRSGSTPVGEFHGFIDYLLRSVTMAMHQVFSELGSVPDRMSTSSYGKMSFTSGARPLMGVSLLVTSGHYLAPVDDGFEGILVLNGSIYPYPSIFLRFMGLASLAVLSTNTTSRMELSMEGVDRSAGLREVMLECHSIDTGPDILSASLSGLPARLLINSTTNVSGTEKMDLSMSERIGKLGLGAGVEIDPSGRRASLDVLALDIPNTVHITRTHGVGGAGGVDGLFDDGSGALLGDPYIGSVSLSLSDREPLWLPGPSTTFVNDRDGITVTSSMERVGAFSYADTGERAGGTLELDSSKPFRFYGYLNDSNPVNTTRIRGYMSGLPDRLEGSSLSGMGPEGIVMTPQDAGEGGSVSGTIRSVGSLTTLLRTLFITTANLSVALTRSTGSDGTDMSFAYTSDSPIDVVSEFSRGLGVASLSGIDTDPSSGMDIERNFTDGIRLWMSPPLNVSDADPAALPVREMIHSRMYLEGIPQSLSLSLSVRRNNGSIRFDTGGAASLAHGLLVDVRELGGNGITARLGNLSLDGGSVFGVSMDIGFSLPGAGGGIPRCNLSTKVTGMHPSVGVELFGRDQGGYAPKLDLRIPWLPSTLSEEIALDDGLRLEHRSSHAIPRIEAILSASGPCGEVVNGTVRLKEIPPMVNVAITGVGTGFPDRGALLSGQLPGLSVYSSGATLSFDVGFRALLPWDRGIEDLIASGRDGTNTSGGGDPNTTSYRETLFMASFANLSGKVELIHGARGYSLDVSGIRRGLITFRGLNIGSAFSIDKLDIGLVDVKDLHLQVPMVGPVPLACTGQIGNGSITMNMGLAVGRGMFSWTLEVPVRVVTTSGGPIPFVTAAGSISRSIVLHGGPGSVLILPAPASLVIMNLWWLLLPLEVLGAFLVVQWRGPGKGDGRKGDGRKGDGRKGDGRKGDGRKGDGRKGDGRKAQKGV